MFSTGALHEAKGKSPLNSLALLCTVYCALCSILLPFYPFSCRYFSFSPSLCVTLRLTLKLALLMHKQRYIHKCTFIGLYGLYSLSRSGFLDAEGSMKRESENQSNLEPIQFHWVRVSGKTRSPGRERERERERATQLHTVKFKLLFHRVTCYILIEMYSATAKVKKVQNVANISSSSLSPITLSSTGPGYFIKSETFPFLLPTPFSFSSLLLLFVIKLQIKLSELWQSSQLKSS